MPITLAPKILSSPPKPLKEKKQDSQAFPSVKERTVTVAKGDVLEKIAKNYEVTVEEIIRLNKLKTTRLQIGQHLKIPTTKQPKAKVENTCSS